MEIITELSPTFLDSFHLRVAPKPQERSKWHTVNNNLKVDNLVWLLKYLTLRDLRTLAKVIEVYPGSDK